MFCPHHFRAKIHGVNYISSPFYKNNIMAQNLPAPSDFLGLVCGVKKDWIIFELVPKPQKK